MSFLLRPKKAVALALVMGPVVGFFAIWMLPYRPRQEIPVPKDVKRIVFSPFGRYLGTLHLEGFSLLGYEPISGQARLFDLMTGEECLAVPVTVVSGAIRERWTDAIGFTGQNECAIWNIKLTDKKEGAVLNKITFFDLPTGRQKHSYRLDENTLMVSSPDGGVVLVTFSDTDSDKEPINFTVKNINSKSEIRRFGPDEDEPVFSDGWYLSFNEEKGICKVLDLVTGHTLVEFPEKSSPPLRSFALCPKCLAAVDGAIHILSVGAGSWRTIQLPANDNPNLSPDGEYLAVEASITPQEDWWSPLLKWAGISRQWDGFKVYRLSDACEVGSFEGAIAARFSPDGKTLAIAWQDKMGLYDVPLHKSWGRALIYGLTTFGLMVLLSGFFRKKVGR